MSVEYALEGSWSKIPSETPSKGFGKHSQRSGERCRIGSSRVGAKETGAATPVDDDRLQASARLPTLTSLRIS
jgi:hypothetical protein